MKPRTRADEALVQAVRDTTGISVSGWQVEGWWKGASFPSAGHLFPGQGSIAVYSPWAIEQAAELARLSQVYKRYDELARVLFYEGFAVDLVVLRKIYLRMIDRLEKWMGPVRTEGDLDRLGPKAP